LNLACKYRIRDSMPTILVVEDNPTILNMLASVLDREGFAVLTAECAATALSLSPSKLAQVDVLVTDVIMPGMDGPTLARRLKSENPSLSVLLISGYCAPEQLEMGRSFHFLPKPFSVKLFLRVIRRLATPALKCEGIALTA